MDQSSWTRECLTEALDLRRLRGTVTWRKTYSHLFFVNYRPNENHTVCAAAHVMPHIGLIN